MWNELLWRICKDMQEPIEYLPLGLLAGGFFWLVSALWSRKQKGRKEKGKKGRICPSLFVVYLVVLANIVYFSRDPGSRTGVNLEFLGTWGDTVASRSYVIENVLLFIPFGLLAPGSIPWLKNGRACVFFAGVASAGIELIQLATQRGFCQLDDVVMNIFGAALGWIGYRLGTEII